MATVTFRADEDLVREIDEEADERDLKRSQYLRRILRNRHEHERIREEYETEIQRLEAQCDDLQRQLSAVNRRDQETTEIVEYVEEEREIQRRRERREDRRASAGLLTRAKWFVFGMNIDDEDE